MGIEVMGKWEWECSVGMGMGGMGMGTIRWEGKVMGTIKSFPHTANQNIIA